MGSTNLNNNTCYGIKIFSHIDITMQHMTGKKNTLVKTKTYWMDAKEYRKHIKNPPVENKFNNTFTRKYNIVTRTHIYFD